MSPCPTGAGLVPWSGAQACEQRAILALDLVDLDPHARAVDALSVAQAERVVVLRAADHGAVAHEVRVEQGRLQVGAGALDAAESAACLHDDDALAVDPCPRRERRARRVEPLELL